MLAIRPEQMDALRIAVSAKFVEATLPFLRHEAPEAVDEATDDELRDLVRRVIERGRAHGIEDPYALQQLSLFTVWLGEGFEDDPALARAGEILRDRSSTPSDRVAALEDFIFSEWGGAR